MRQLWAPGRYETLRPPGWHLMHAGLGLVAPASWARVHEVPLTEVSPTPENPDGYVRLVASSFDEKVFLAYLTQWIAVDVLVIK